MTEVLTSEVVMGKKRRNNWQELSEEARSGNVYKMKER